MWRTRLPLGLLLVVASCQPTGDGNESDPIGEIPISDFPRSGHEGSVNPVTVGPGPLPAPITPVSPAGPGGTTTAVAGGAGGGAVGGTGGASAPPVTNPVTPTPPAGSGGYSGGLDAGAPVAGGDAGFIPPLGTNGDAGDGAAPGASGDAGCPRLLAPDSGICAAYGCALSLDQLRASANSAGACSAPGALAAACDGSASSAALRCTEASVFSADIAETTAACVKRDAQLSALGATCLDCFVDEALCTLSRCFASCALASENEACRSCRHQQCGGALSQCTGLPAP